MFLYDDQIHLLVPDFIITNNPELVNCSVSIFNNIFTYLAMTK